MCPPLACLFFVRCCLWDSADSPHSLHTRTLIRLKSLSLTLSLYLSSLERLCFSVHTFDWVILRRTQLLSLYFTPVVPHRKGKGNALRLLATSDTLPQHADIWVCLTHWRRNRQTETDLINYIRTRWARRWRKRKPKGRKDKKRPTDRREGEKTNRHTVQSNWIKQHRHHLTRTTTIGWSRANYLLPQSI